ncbi:uncharacterized protein LOC114292481 isoform X5 [Camellia sinensis]|nr:uncharacterized protein LOC114292481 isoform X5 [Camellia sinensis]XP_028092261.1 uncharacterized protein LOC114292481 isoform X5 [Camellia sinensis]XP_028092262.1 uncharacterized protein LOC114292481 isoform X5 [Camellia sinensis]
MDALPFCFICCELRSVYAGSPFKEREEEKELTRTAGKKLISLIALALNLDEDFFEKDGAFNPPMPFLRLLHYPG